MHSRRSVHGTRHLDLDAECREGDKDKQSETESKLICQISELNTRPTVKFGLCVMTCITLFWLLEKLQHGEKSGKTLLVDLQAYALYDRE